MTVTSLYHQTNVLSRYETEISHLRIYAQIEEKKLYDMTEEAEQRQKLYIMTVEKQSETVYNMIVSCDYPERKTYK